MHNNLLQFVYVGDRLYLTQVAGYQNPGASDPEISAIANDKLAVARSATTISSNHYKQCNEAVSGINNCLL
ncbi:hypothetical protein B4U84_18940 [Westiellopsis prolifica IICB1]|nr:hypothetical protein B4U84_18940 [Westiellopsis prolifica IICB1]